MRAADTGRREATSIPGRRTAPRPARTRRRWWREHAGLFIAGAALLAFVLGVVGFHEFLPGRRFTDYVYRSLELFVLYVEHLGSPDPNARLPWTLEIARFLAPAATAAASIRALLALFGQRAAQTWVRYFVRNHVLVCGLGPFGARLAVAFAESGHRVVAIEPDTSEGTAENCRAAGVTVLTGDATDRELLLNAGILTARYLFVASADDRRNADVALAARDVAGRRRRPLPCYVHVVRSGLSALLGEATLASGGHERLRFEFFNPWESVPPLVLDEYPPADSDADSASGSAPHMVVVGSGRLGQALAVHAARRWTGEPESVTARLGVTLVGPGATSAADDLARRYRRLEQVCDLRAADVDLDSVDFEHGAYLDGRAVTAAYVALDDDASGLQAALRLFRIVPRARVVVLATEHSGLGTLVTQISPAGSPIALFDVLERSARPEIVLNGTNELLARSIHYNYVRAQVAAGHTAGDNPALRPWDDLPESTKEANRAQAADIGTKLAAVGCRIRPWTDWTGEGFLFTDEEIERMAELEHDRWRRERLVDGWTFGPARDDERRTSPYLVPWGELPEDVKEHQNRSAVRVLPELLADAGYEIVRVPE